MCTIDTIFTHKYDIPMRIFKDNLRIDVVTFDLLQMRQHNIADKEGRHLSHRHRSDSLSSQGLTPLRLDVLLPPEYLYHVTQRPARPLGVYVGIITQINYSILSLSTN
jgi:hypothetical protein